MSKKITRQQLTGQRGVNLIEKIVLEMGFVWRQTGMDAGIDGQIEIRDSATSALQGKLIHVQSKATTANFKSEDEYSFVFHCRSADIEYWRTMNTPVLLILSRPETAEAYWVCIQEYFSQGVKRDIRFDKTSDRFDVTAKFRLERLLGVDSTALVTANSTADKGVDRRGGERPVAALVPYHLPTTPELAQPRQDRQKSTDDFIKTFASSVRLYLHAQTDNQRRYDLRLQNVIQASTSLPTVLDEANPWNAGLSLRLLEPGAVSQPFSNEIQICQLDEFWLPRPTADHRLARFAARMNKPEDCNVACIQSGGPLKSWSSHAVPYYLNPSLLAYRGDVVDATAISSWRSIISLCRGWQDSHDGAVAFDFATSYEEDYNCLFLEILLSCVVERGGAIENVYDDWICRPEAIEAAVMLRELCRPAHLSRVDEDTGSLALKQQAIVWRHWYSTFAELASSLPWAQREKVVVAPLPGGLNLAGEWYLAVMPRSAAPDYAIEIVREITKPEAELERLNCGVGLPARPSFYNVAVPLQSDWRIALQDLAIDTASLRSLIEFSILRSSFRGYSHISMSLSRHLRRIIELPEEDWRILQNRIRGILQNVHSQMRFLEEPEHH